MACDRFCPACKERKTCDKPLEAYVQFGEYDREVRVVVNGWHNRNKVKYALWKRLRVEDPLFTDSFFEFARSARVTVTHNEALLYCNYFLDMRKEVNDGE